MGAGRAEARRLCLTCCAALAVAQCARSQPAQQSVDRDFGPAPLAAPAYPAGRGPVLWFDEGHQNLVTRTGLFSPLVAVVEADGYRTASVTGTLTAPVLARTALLVIGEPGAAEDSGSGAAPAFAEQEVHAVTDWVSRGGSLLLLVDHMPTSGAAASLGAALGFVLHNGFVIDWDAWDDTLFVRTDGTLATHAVTEGATPAERVTEVAAFFGAAFEAEAAEPVLVIGAGYDLFFPSEPWAITESTPRRPAAGMYMGATRRVGQGRVAVFSDASMFSAQISQFGAKMGMNTASGRQNQQLLLNVLHWLDGRLD